jgi:C1A family cysteine protease
MAKKTKSVRDTAPADRICNLVPSVGTESDWQLEDAVSAGALGAPVTLPREVDLRQNWWDVGDQEATGSCVGWATGEGVMRYVLVAAGKLDPDQHVSARYVWMGSKETDDFTTRPETFIEASGTSLKAAVSLCVKFGVVTTDVLPFRLNTTLYGGAESTFWATAAQRRASAYYNVGKNLDAWKAALAGGSPVLVGLSVDATWDAATNTAGELKDFQPATTRGGHAVCAVGHRRDGAIIIRNSWGTGWGDKGFAYASPEYISEGFFPEAYAVTM